MIVTGLFKFDVTSSQYLLSPDTNSVSSSITHYREELVKLFPLVNWQLFTF